MGKQQYSSLRLNLTPEAHEAIATFAAVNGVTVSAFLQSLGEGLLRHPELLEPDTGPEALKEPFPGLYQLLREARRVAGQRRRRLPDAEARRSADPATAAG